MSKLQTLELQMDAVTVQYLKSCQALREAEYALERARDEEHRLAQAFGAAKIAYLDEKHVWNNCADREARDHCVDCVEDCDLATKKTPADK